MSRAKSLTVAAVLSCVSCVPALGWTQQEEPSAAAANAESEKQKDLEADAGIVREVRLALVCYGGSSLAIYMHGNTKELFRLVQASKWLELDVKKDDAFKRAVLGHQPGEPLALGPRGQALTGSTRQWYERLLEVWDTDPKKVRTRVIIDVIAGTSAGGINGVILAKALAHDVSIDELTNLWMTKASLGKLTNHYFGLFRVLGGGAPVDGDALLGWLYDALKTMDNSDAGKHSLLPTGDRLDLFVTATDRYGYPQNLVVGEPDSAAEERHRHVLHFSYPGYKQGCDAKIRNDHFCPYWTPALAFAARASSSIPGVFPPVGVPAALTTVGAPASLDHDVTTSFFRNYQLQNPNTDEDDTFLTRTYFVDGGVLDNHPFDPAIAEVFKRPQDQEVRRFLVYLQPDPGKPPAPAPTPKEGKPPSLLATIWAGLSGIPSGQPILDSLTDVADHNVRLDRLRDIVRAEEQAVRAKERLRSDGGDCTDPDSLSVAERFACYSMEVFEGAMPRRVTAEDVEARLAKADEPQIATLRRELERRAREGANELANRSYVSVRVHSVLDQLVTVIASGDAVNYPPDSAQRALLRKIVERWAMERRLIGSAGKEMIDGAAGEPGGELEKQLEFLDEFDVGYPRRQLRFVVDWVNTQYGPDEKLDANTRYGEEQIRKLPSIERRRHLDAVKRAAAVEIKKLTALIDGSSPELRGQLGGVTVLFGHLRPWKEIAQLDGSLDEQAEAFIRDSQKLAALDSLRTAIGKALRQEQQKIRAESFKSFRELTADDTLNADWTAADRREILVRYLGFPFWDEQIYPLLAFADIGEFDQVKIFRLSPDDATLLDGGPAKTKLTGARKAHFGAFLSRRGREDDYLWGRLDAAERMLKLLGLSNAGAKPLFTAILDDEKDQERPVVRASILAERRKKVEALP